MSIIGSAIKGTSKVVGVLGKVVILIIGKSIFIFTKPSNTSADKSIGDAGYEKAAKLFEEVVVGTGDVAGNIIDKLVEVFTGNIGTKHSKFKAIHTEMEEALTKEKDPYLKQCKIGEMLRLEHEKFSLYKPNSIAVYKGYQHLGYLSEESTKFLIPLMDNGYTFKGTVERVIKGKKGKGYNLKIIISAMSEPLN